MKTFFVFILGLIVGGVILYLYRAQPQGANASLSEVNLSEQARDAAHHAANKTREVAANVSDTFNDKIKDWHLTRDDIKADLSKTGQVVRDNAARVGEKISDARIVTVIHAKYVLDRELSDHDLDVACVDGKVTLAGSVTSEALIGKAVAEALDTEGVHHVTSKIAVQPRSR